MLSVFYLPNTRKERNKMYKNLVKNKKSIHCILEEIEHACSHLDIMPSHHASMEIGDCMSEVDEALTAIENLR